MQASARLPITNGFTLIEILVVIAVIGVLATVILLAINPVEMMERAQDSDRRTKLGQITQALEAYATQHNGLYPSTCASGTLTCITTSSTGSNPSDSVVYFSRDVQGANPPGVAILAKGEHWIPGLIEGGYIKRLPYDSRTKKGSRICEDSVRPYAGYMYRSNGYDFKIVANCTVSTDMEKWVPGVSTTYGTYCIDAWGQLLQKPKGRMVDPVRWSYAYSLYTNDAACWP